MPAIRGADGKGEQLARQQGQLRRLAAGVHRQAVGVGRASGFHRDAFWPDARSAGGDGHALQAALQRQEGVEIPGVFIVGQRQENMGLRAGRAHRADQPVQRGRGQVEAVEEYAGFLQKNGFGGAFHGLCKFRFPVLKAPLQQVLIGFQYDSKVVQLHAQQAVGLFGAGI